MLLWWCKMPREHRVSEKVTMLAAYCPVNTNLGHMNTTTYCMTQNKFGYLLQIAVLLVCNSCLKRCQLFTFKWQKPSSSHWTFDSQHFQAKVDETCREAEDIVDQDCGMAKKKTCFDNKNSCLVWTERQSCPNINPNMYHILNDHKYFLFCGWS